MPSSYTLGSHYEGFVRELVQSGRYASASEVMRDGLRMMEERENLFRAKLAALRSDIAEGLDSGPAAPLDMEAIRPRLDDGARQQVENRPYVALEILRLPAAERDLV